MKTFSILATICFIITHGRRPVVLVYLIDDSEPDCLRTTTCAVSELDCGKEVLVSFGDLKFQSDGYDRKQVMNLLPLHNDIAWHCRPCRASFLNATKS